MSHHECCYLAGQSVIRHHVAFAHLVQHRYNVSLAIGSPLGGLHSADVRDIAVRAYDIVVDVVAYVFYQAVVANGNVTQCGVIHACASHKRFAYLDAFVERAQFYIAIKGYVFYGVGVEIVGHHYALPVFGPAVVIFQLPDFFFVQLSVFHVCVAFYVFFIIGAVGSMA